jgi:uncharacterized protein Yka (UPF0111/DUF47 family)
MDDILDLMEDVATSLFLYDVKALTPDAQRLGEICVACTIKVRDAVAKLESMDNADAILQICGEIDRLESEADRCSARGSPSCSARSPTSGRSSS